MQIIISESQLKTLLEYSYKGRYEGDLVRVGEFSKYRLPKPVLLNVLKAISYKVGEVTTAIKFKNGEYDDVEIRLFGQLFAFLTGSY